jgi:GntR family transcriptional regulator/MocR family aminotransferase
MSLVIDHCVKPSLTCCEEVRACAATLNKLCFIRALALNPDAVVVKQVQAICEEPGYSVAREQFRSHGADVRTIAVDDQGFNVKRMRDTVESADWLYLTPSGQDPTGTILSESRRIEVLNWAQARGAAIIEDGWDSDFHYGGPVIPPLQAMDNQGCVIYMHTFWRLLFPLVSTAFVVIPEKLIPLFRNSKHISDHQYPLIEHYVLTKFIKDGDFENHIRSSWKVLRERRQAMIFELNKHFATEFKLHLQEQQCT